MKAKELLLEIVTEANKPKFLGQEKIEIVEGTHNGSFSVTLNGWIQTGIGITEDMVYEGLLSKVIYDGLNSLKS